MMWRQLVTVLGLGVVWITACKSKSESPTQRQDSQPVAVAVEVDGDVVVRISRDAKSPSGGGTDTWYNPSVQDYFYDTGAAWDPPLGAEPVSKNGVIDLP